MGKKKRKFMMPVVNSKKVTKAKKPAIAKKEAPAKKIGKVVPEKIERKIAKAPVLKKAAAGKEMKKLVEKKATKAIAKKSDEEKIEQEAKSIVEEQAAQEKKEAPEEEKADEVQEAFAPKGGEKKDEAEKVIEEKLAGREEEGKKKAKLGEGQGILNDYVNPEDANKLFLDVSTEAEKGEPESNLEALVGSKRQLPDNIKEGRVIEAALFMSSKPLSVQELAKLTGIAAIGYVENEIRNLQAEYEQKGSAIAIANEEGRYIMRLRPEYLKFVKDFAQEGELSRTALKVLAYVAKSEGILKSSLVKRIGTTVYEGVAELVEKGFVDQRKSGRSSTLRTTQKFREYFSQ